jgi:hypothetical protein
MGGYMCKCGHSSLRHAVRVAKAAKGRRFTWPCGVKGCTCGNVESRENPWRFFGGNPMY